MKTTKLRAATFIASVCAAAFTMSAVTHHQNDREIFAVIGAVALLIWPTLLVAALWPKKTS